MTDLHYTDPRLARLYDQDCGWGADLGFYLALAPAAPCRILDLGCGTGRLCLAFANLGHRVTGVDPAAAMLSVARSLPGGAAVNWVQATAQTFASPDRFDLIVMTGHAFQVLIEDAAVDAALTAIRTHLAPGGTLAFETRNPALDWAGRWDGELGVLTLDDQPVLQSRYVLQATADLITFETHYAFRDATLISTSTLRFHTRAALQTRLATHGLACHSILGDWSAAAFDPDHSDEIVFLANPA